MVCKKRELGQGVGGVREVGGGGGEEKVELVCLLRVT